MVRLGKLEKVALRTAWPHEALDFTRWLADEQNFADFCDEVGIELRITQTEANVGRFNVDILAEEEGTGRKAVIENQLESTDHSHLGQIITYAAGLGAEYVFWVVKDAREEHRQAVDWLNAHTDEAINLFLVKVELWQIGTSQPAPKFTLISSPNNWTKLLRRGADSGRTPLTDARVLQLDFWQRLKSFGESEDRYRSIRFRKPLAQHWYDISLGSSDCHVALIANTRGRTIGCEIYIPDAKAFFHRLKENQAAIDARLSGTGNLDWQDLADKKAARIRTTKTFDITADDSEEGFRWLLDGYTAFREAMKPYLRTSSLLNAITEDAPVASSDPAAD